MRIGILGGRFDPPHLGHLWVAQQVLESAGLDEVWFIPYNKRNLDEVKGKRLKVKSANNEQRLEMTKLAIRRYKKFKVLDVEIKRGGVSYTIDTIKELKEKHPDCEFYIIIGSDLVEELPKWKEYEKLIKMVEFLVFPRNGYKVETHLPAQAGNIASLHIIKPDIVNNLSSTIIREKVKKGLSINRMVRKGVENYIMKNKLYK